ncbi:MAG: helix-turn-helix domain-containing protein [Draconibacterium sp.]
MKDRIKSYMDYKGITAGELSLALDVQRSNISHILNGRNMPGAALIEKLLLKYTDLDARWLITGKGNMIHENAPGDQPAVDDGIKNENSITTNEKIVKPIISTPNEKRLDKIVLLFNDGTFIDYKK